MTETEAIAVLASMVDAAAEPALSNDDLKAALAKSLIPDAAGVWPGQLGYIPTWDMEWAAAEATLMHHMRAMTVPGAALTKVTSEGTTFEGRFSGPDWLAISKWWRSRSALGRQLGYDSLNVVEVPAPPVNYVPTSEGLSSWI